MAWQAIDRITPAVDPAAGPVLNDALRDKIRSFLPRYETKRAALLPALHIVQDALGHISFGAMAEIAGLLEIPPSQVMDTLSFYTHFWDHHKGKKVVVLCRSLSCQIMGTDSVLEKLKEDLGIDEHGTTKDGQYSLVTEECLAACDHAPCMLINEKLHKKVNVDQVGKILKDPKNADIAVPRSDLFDGPKAPEKKAHDGNGDLPTTSDVREMKES